jgi:hypothetical protein
MVQLGLRKRFIRLAIRFRLRGSHRLGCSAIVAEPVGVK